MKNNTLNCHAEGGYPAGYLCIQLLTVTLYPVRVTLNVCVCFSAGPTTWSDIWTPARPLQNYESTCPRSLCFYPGEAQPSTPIFRAMSPLHLPPSHQASTQDRNIPGMLTIVLGKCLGVTLYKCCLFVIAWHFLFFLFFSTQTHMSSLPACIRTLLRIYLMKTHC